MKYHAAMRSRLPVLASLPVLAMKAALMPVGALAQERTVTMVLPEEPDIVDPCHSTRSNIGRVVKQNVAETLLEINPADGSLKPRLATAWEQVDELTWRFELRDGIVFHDGTPFDAEAVATSVNRTLNPQLDCEIRTKFFGNTTVTPNVVGSHTIAFKTAQPSPILPTMMGTMTITAPSTIATELTREPIGTGPYVFTSWAPGQNVVLTRFEDYWGEAPEVEEATYIWRAESSVRAAMVRTGEADIAPSIAVQDAGNPDLDFSYFDSETTNLRIDVSIPPLDDVRVRRAINLAIDREAIRGSILPEGVVPAAQFVVPGINGHNADLKAFPYDPEEAARLIEEARAEGVPVDQEILIIGRRGIHAGVTETLEVVHAMLQGVGLNVCLQVVEVAEWIDLYTKPFNEDRQVNILHAMHDNNNCDAVFTAFNKYHSEGAESTLADPAIDDLIERATVAIDPERRALWEEMFRILHEDIIADVSLFHMVGFTRVSPRIDFVPTIAVNSELRLAQITFN